MRTLGAVLLVLAAGGRSDVEAAIPPVTPLAEKVHRHPDLHVLQSLQPVVPLPADLSADLAFFDPRAGRVTSLVLSEPLIPGTGAGNDLEWATPPMDDASRRDAVWRGVVDYLQRQQAALRLDLTELSPPRVAILEKGNLIQAWSQRVVGGIPVRGSGATAIVNHGNLVLLGLEHWGDVRAALPLIEAGDARSAVERHVAPFVIEFFTHDPRLEYIPMARGDGYDYRLAWVVSATISGDLGSWEGLVDAASGALLAFDDTNQYARHAIGGVYPVSNDQRPPDGIEQPGWPLPFLDLTTPTGTVTTNSSGSFACLSGSVSTALTGRSTRINEACGAINESSPSGDLDLGFGPAPGSTDCDVPPGHSAGDTKAARTAFHEVTRINEQARGYLPANAWLQTPLTANVNVNISCGAFWNGSSITFYRDNGSPCRNAGEIAGILDHEWGHGMDANGVNPNLSQPFEAIADVHALLRLDVSCIGRGFFKNMVCSGYGDPCTGNPATGCTGVRDVDFAGHVCGRPHTVTWIMTGFPAGHCVDGVARPACPMGTPGPCGRLVHCESHVVSETAFDLARRDLPAAGLDAITSQELVTRLFFLGSQAVTSWYTCAAGGGCAATGGYLLTLAADDDDGNLANGTPHMTAIRAAFERHQIHCATPPAVDSGCAGGPTQAPVLTATALPETTFLSWTAVPNAAGYLLYRSDGVSGCDYGRIKIAELTGTSFADGQLLGGHTYSYVVLPVGANTACFGRASNCASANPVPVGCVAQSDFTLSCAPSTLLVTAGATGQSTCTVSSQNAFSAPVTLSCTGLPAGVTCSYNPPAPTPPPNLSVTSTLTVTVGAAVPPGTYNFQAQGVSGPLTHTFAMTLNVTAVSVAPQALAMDASGNGVFQPDETVVMAPTWRNTGTGAITLTGATSNHTGPPGGTYSNPDAAAAYGVIPAGGQSACSDCYTVRAAAGTRPLTHWDSTILETVSPSNTTTTWTLHIGDSFTDVPASSPFFGFVETILHKGVTGGCTASAYCPTSSTTREQMAVFVLVSKEPPGYLPPACSPPNLFTDVPETSPFCRWIEELANRAVVGGCTAGTYCPTAPASREQMAVFVLRTLDPALSPPACVPPNLFADVPETSPFCRWIEELANRGVVTGCGGGNYCPTADVSREQMSVFLAVTFGLELYGP